MTTTPLATPISIAYSPDTDDAFMVHAMRQGRVDQRGYTFTYTAADIQVLNEAATRGVYDVTAISIAAYPSLADDYLLMPVGASIGDAFGPAIIVRADSPVRSVDDLAGKRIAVPGLQTSAFFAARGLIGAFDAQPMTFTDIGPAVARGDVDAGILIHELQIDCERHGFRRLGDLGSLWAQRFSLPLPLGGNAIRRSLGERAIADVTQIMRESIEVGLATRDETLRSALAASKADLDLALGDRYIDMYVNDRSLRFEADVREAMTRLFAIGAEAGLCKPCDVGTAFVDEHV
jgi:1,4-dihydroxy-6-naphthoate synthase